MLLLFPCPVRTYFFRPFHYTRRSVIHSWRRVREVIQLARNPARHLLRFHIDHRSARVDMRLHEVPKLCTHHVESALHRDGPYLRCHGRGPCVLHLDAFQTRMDS